MAEPENSLPVQAKKLCFAQRQQTLFSCGENSGTPVSTSGPASHKRGSIALSSVTKVRTKAASWFAKRIELLISSGLIAGITPTWIRHRSGASCRGLASFLLVGDMYESDTDAREQKRSDS